MFQNKTRRNSKKSKKVNKIRKKKQSYNPGHNASNGREKWMMTKKERTMIG